MNSITFDTRKKPCGDSPRGGARNSDKSDDAGHGAKAAQQDAKRTMTFYKQRKLRDQMKRA